MIDGHGDDLYAYDGLVRHNFSSNILSGVNHEALAWHIAGCVRGIAGYPEPVPLSLERMLSERLGISPSNVMVTGGATEAIYLIAHACACRDSIVVAPTFSEYEDACTLYNHNVRFMDWDSLASWNSGETVVSPAVKDSAVVWLCNPNNPTGKVLDVDKLRHMILSVPESLFVIDQAYADYTTEAVLSADEAVRMGNVLLLGSFTKRYSVPGLRIGYAVGSDGIMEAVKAVRMPWSVSVPAIECGKYLLSHSDSYVIDCRGLHSEALRLADELRKIGLEVMDTDCNFMLACLPAGTSHELKEWLIYRHGILIRDASNFHGLTERHFRVAAQTREENDLLIYAMKEWSIR